MARERPRSEPRPVLRRSLGSPALFAIVWSSLAAAVYFSLGIVAENALGMTPGRLPRRRDLLRR